MRRSPAHRIRTLCIFLLLALGGVVHAQRIVEEKGRELLGPDGRTLIDKQDGFSIVLPAPDWKVRLDRGEPLSPDEAGFALALASPNGDVRLWVHQKVYPRAFPVFSVEQVQKLAESHRDARLKVLRNKIVKVGDTKCWEYETEENQVDNRPRSHDLGWFCDQDPWHKFSVRINPVPSDQWPAEEKVLRELVESFRVLD